MLGGEEGCVLRSLRGRCPEDERAKAPAPSAPAELRQDLLLSSPGRHRLLLPCILQASSEVMGNNWESLGLCFVRR